MKRPILSKIVSKLSPTGLIIAILAFFLLIGFVLYFGTFAIDGGWFSFTTTNEGETSEIQAPDSISNGVSPADRLRSVPVVQPELDTGPGNGRGDEKPDSDRD